MISGMKPASDQETSPLTFGRYEALLRIGRGGMAEVYAGRVRGEAGFQKTNCDQADASPPGGGRAVQHDVSRRSQTGGAYFESARCHHP